MQSIRVNNIGLSDKLNKELRKDNLRLWGAINIIRHNRKSSVNDVLHRMFQYSDKELQNTFPSKYVQIIRSITFC